MGSMMSPDLLQENVNINQHFFGNSMTCLQMGICIGLSLVSTYRPKSVSFFMTSRRAWNRFIP